MSKEIIKDETGTYMIIPRDKIKFVSKEAEIMFDIVMENDYLQQENNALKEKFRATNKGLQKVRLKRKKWKHRYVLARYEIKKLKTQLEVGEQQYNDLVEEKESLQEQLSSNILQLEELKRQNEFLMKRDNKCQMLEQQYCERTDCSGRLGTSKKVEALEKENKELKNILDQMGIEPNEMLYLKEENQELKSQLKGTTHCFDEEEHERLKKQLEECIATNEVLSHELTKDKILKQDHLTTCYGIPIGDIPKLINQQKVFIEYLEDEIKLYENDIRNFSKDYKVYFSLINDLRVSRTKTEEILQKYKEIVNGIERS